MNREFDCTIVFHQLILTSDLFLSAGSSYYNKAEKKVVAASIKTYVEQEVERLAWEKHGSPEGFDF